jgi:hydrogenase expression/formation protein HypC
MSGGEPLHCTTCGDVAIPMTVIEIERASGLAQCSAGDGSHHTVELSLIDDARPGEHVLVHAGVALGRLGPPESR